MNAGLDYCLVTTTCAKEAEARSLADQILGERLAACVQMLPITSHYVWKGEVNRDPEVLLLIKTRRALYEKLEAFIASRHTYDVPEIVRLPIEGGAASYVKWIDEVTAEG